LLTGQKGRMSRISETTASRAMMIRAACRRFVFTDSVDIFCFYLKNRHAKVINLFRKRGRISKNL